MEQAKALSTIKAYREFSGRLEITLYGYLLNGKVNAFQVPITHKGYDFEKTKNRFLKKVKAWSLKSKIWLYFEWKIETVEPAHNGFGGHWMRVNGRQWSKKSEYTKGSDGRQWSRAECRADTALHHMNCGLPNPRPQIQGWKWDPQ